MLSIWTVVTFYQMLMPRIFTHVRRLHLGQNNAQDLPITKNILIVFGASSLALLVGLMTYWICDAKVVNDPVWEENVREKCPDTYK